MFNDSIIHEIRITTPLADWFTTLETDFKNNSNSENSKDEDNDNDELAAALKNFGIKTQGEKRK